MVRPKTRKESGRKYNKFYNPEKGEYYEQYWDDWIDHRDGFRNIGKDLTKKQPTNINKEHYGNKRASKNKKIHKQNKIRQKRKLHPRNNT